MNAGNTINNVTAGVWNNTENSRKDLSENEQQSTSEWTCECGTKNTGKFCVNCGKPKTEEKHCNKCNATLKADGKFCPNCGERLD